MTRGTSVIMAMLLVGVWASIATAEGWILWTHTVLTTRYNVRELDRWF
jgi:hypothetical protein